MCIFRAQVLNVLLTVIGALFIAYGVIFLLRHEWTGGAVSPVIGIVLILGGWLFVEIVLIIFGILLTLKGVSDLVTAIRFRMPLAIIFACDIGNRNIACCKLLGNVGLVFHFAGGNFHRERHFGVVATQTNVVLLTRQRTGNRPFLIATILLNNANRKSLCRSKFFRNIAFVWLNCVSSPPPLHNQTNFRCTKTKDGNPSFFIAPILPNTQARPLQKQVFPCTLICFATQLHLHCLVQKNRTA